MILAAGHGIAKLPTGQWSLGAPLPCFLERYNAQRCRKHPELAERIRVWETEGLYFWLDALSNRGICGMEQYHFPGIGGSLSFFTHLFQIPRFILACAMIDFFDPMVK